MTRRLWSQIRLNVGAFMQGLFLQGAFQGTTPQQAYFVKCDGENNPQSSIDLGIVNILVGFAPLYPAEFVVIQIQQIAGQARKAARQGGTRHGAIFPANPKRLDPYKNFKFRLKWDGQYVAGVSKMSTAEAHHRSRGTPRAAAILPPRTSLRAATSTKPSRWSAA